MNIDKEKIWGNIQDDSRMTAYNKEPKKRLYFWLSGVFLCLLISIVAFVTINDKKNNAIQLSEEDIRSHTSIVNTNEKLEKVVLERQQAKTVVNNLLQEQGVAKEKKMVVNITDARVIDKTNRDISFTEETIEKSLEENNEVINEMTISQTKPLGTPEKKQNKSLANTYYEEGYNQQDNNETNQLIQIQIQSEEKAEEALVINMDNVGTISQMLHSYLPKTSIMFLDVKSDLSLDLEVKPILKHEDKKQSLIKYGYFVQTGYGFSNSSVNDRTSEKDLILDEFYSPKYSWNSRVGFSVKYNNFIARIAADYTQNIFDGRYMNIDTSYNFNVDNTLTKRADETTYHLHQKHMELGIGLSMAYLYRYNSWGISPYIGIRAIVYSKHDVSVLTKSNIELDVAKFSPIRESGLQIPIGIRLQRNVTQKLSGYVDLSGSFNNRYGVKNQYSVDIQTWFISIGIQRNI